MEYGIKKHERAIIKINLFLIVLNMKSSFKEIFEYNEKWITDNLAADPNFFKNLSLEQKPDYLFIGCSDSRVDPDTFTGFKVGDVFVHRNVSNIVNPIDLNVTSVIQYAILNLKIKHIIVCGHYGCGGIKAAMEEKGIGKNSPWLQIIKDIYRIHKTELEKIKDESKRYDRLVELNVKEQAENVMKMDCLQPLVGTLDYPQIHGWVFDMRTGRIIDLKLNHQIESKVEHRSLFNKLKLIFKNNT